MRELLQGVESVTLPLHRVRPAGDTLPGMQILDLYRWRVTDPVSRRCYITRYPLSEVNAKDLDPGAERIEGSHERIMVPTLVLPPSAQRRPMGAQ